MHYQRKNRRWQGEGKLLLIKRQHSPQCLQQSGQRQTCRLAAPGRATPACVPGRPHMPTGTASQTQVIEWPGTAREGLPPVAQGTFGPGNGRDYLLLGMGCQAQGIMGMDELLHAPDPRPAAVWDQHGVPETVEGRRPLIHPSSWRGGDG